MTWTTQDNFLGLPRVGDYSSTTQQWNLGSQLLFTDPYWGAGEFIYLKANGAIANGNVVVWDLSNFATACPNTAGLGRPVATAVGGAAASGQFGWFQVAGQAYVSTTASVAAGTGFGLTGAGTVGALSAGKQIVGAVSAAPGTTTVVKTNVSTTTGSPVITVPGGADGWFVGATMTGTGISGTITAIAANNRDVTLSANASATGIISATATYTNFIIATMQRPFAQGQIT